MSRAVGAPAADFLDFSQNINPLGAPAVAVEAARAAGFAGYPDLGYPELRSALGEYLGVSRDCVLPTNGGAEALFLAARVAAENRVGVRAVILEPTFSEYAAAARAAGFEVERRVTRRAEAGFTLEPSFLGDIEDVGLVFLCNPNNPTGGAMRRQEVLEISHRLGEAGAVLVVDEAFVDFVPEASVASSVGRSGFENLLVARSFTKFFGIPGLRLGALISSDTELPRSFQPSWSVNSVAAAAGISAAGDYAFAETSIAEVARLRGDLYARLDALPGIQPYPGAANFLLVHGPAELSN
ncbi:MAG TPA: aminotransferase class I/II-fold pyridoxal phosphate-dependent enzyme, partial [Rubrobacteraceae bacterium]|nr:aminotransferase class I/II-fold pyridoxal phosphate-dependent enzyme [Rubrobacteraceae bacterium]